ncbi:hypothetical protein EXT52_20285 [Pectobacterium polaris]|nr:hypothetical protein [Pectobacterium polaris]
MCRIYRAAHRISVRTIYTLLAQSVTQKLLTSAGLWAQINAATLTAITNWRIRFRNLSPHPILHWPRTSRPFRFIPPNLSPATHCVILTA